MSERIAAALALAKALIDRPEKWRKGASSKTDTAICASQAIYEVSGTPISALQSLRAAIGGKRIVGWNDAPERTHAEVMAAFDLAIAAERDEA